MINMSREWVLSCCRIEFVTPRGIQPTEFRRLIWKDLDLNPSWGLILFSLIRACGVLIFSSFSWRILISWFSPEEEILPSKLKNYYKSVAEHKDITKLLMVLTSVISSTKAEVMTCLDSFTQFHSVWDEDKEKAVAVSTLLLKHYSFKGAVLRYFVNNDSYAFSFAMELEKLF